MRTRYMPRNAVRLGTAARLTLSPTPPPLPPTLGPDSIAGKSPAQIHVENPDENPDRNPGKLIKKNNVETKKSKS